MEDALDQLGVSLIPKEKIEDQHKHQQKYIRNSKNFNNTKLENYISLVKQNQLNESRCNSSQGFGIQGVTRNQFNNTNNHNYNSIKKYEQYQSTWSARLLASQRARSQLDDNIHNPATFRALRNCTGTDITLMERGDTIESEKV
jgi:hypothetical protein